MANNRLYICNKETNVYCIINKVYYFVGDVEEVWNSEKLYYFMKYNKNGNLITGYESDYIFYDVNIKNGIDFTCIELERKEKLKKLNEK